MSTRTFTFTVTAPPPGSWNPATQTVNTWAEISNTKLSDQPVLNASPGAPSGKQDAWCGWCIDTRTSDVYSVGQGGHANYIGNEVNRIRLSDAVPAWTQVAPPTAPTYIPGATGYVAGTPAPDGYYEDGRPVSTHGYGTSIFVPSINRAMRFPGGSASVGGNGTQAVTVFNAVTGLYDSASVWNPLTLGTSGDASGSVFVMHPDTERVFWWYKNIAMFRWTPGVPGSWTQLAGSPPTNLSYSSGACDPTRGTAGKILFLGHAAGSLSYLYDIAANTYQSITLTGTNLASGTALSLVYVSATDRYYACVNHTTFAQVYVIDPNTWSCTPLNTGTTGSGIPLSTWSPGANDGTMALTKFLYAPNLGGCVYGPKWGTNLWFLKLH